MVTLSAGASASFTLTAGYEVNGTGAGTAVIGRAGTVQALTNGDAWQIGPYTTAQTVSITATSAMTYDAVPLVSTSPSPADLGLSAAQVAATAALVSADGIVEAIGAGFGRTDMQRPGQAVFNWADVSIGTVTAGWNVAVDPSVTFGGLPSLRISSTTTTPLAVTITLPANTSLGNTKRLQMAIRCGDAALGAGAAAMRCSSAATTARAGRTVFSVMFRPATHPATGRLAPH